MEMINAMTGWDWILAFGEILMIVGIALVVAGLIVDYRSGYFND